MLNYFALPGLKEADFMQRIGDITVMRACTIPDGAVVRIGNIDRIAMRHSNGMLVVRHLNGGCDRVYIMPRSREWIQVTAQRRGTRPSTRKQTPARGYRATSI